MYISFTIIKELWNKEKLEKFKIELNASDTQNAQIFRIDEKKAININLILTDEYLKKLEDQKVEKISIYYNPQLMKILKRHYPDRYYTEEIEPLYKVEHLFLQFEMANKQSSYEGTFFKKRYLKILQDIISSDFKIKKIIAVYNDLLNRESLLKIKALFSDSININFIQSERGILLVLDNTAYKKNPLLVRLQLMVRKIFSDINYSYFKAVDVASGFKEYFKPTDDISKKLVILVGKTENHLFLFKKIKFFDPFSKIVWITQEHLNSKPDLIFDSIITKLKQDYTEEYKIYSKPREEKNPLPQKDLQNYRKFLTVFHKKFNLKGYIELGFDIQEKGKDYDMFQPKTHLMNILLDLRYSPKKVFNQLMSE